METLFRKIEAAATARLTLPPGRQPSQEIPRYRTFLKVETHRLKMLHRAGGGGLEICAARAHIIDLLLQHFWDVAKQSLSAQAQKEFPKVAFIAILPLSKTWVLESAEAVSGMLGGQAVSGASLVLEETQDRGQLSPLMTRLWALGEQWNLAGSPVGDAVAGNWKAGDGRDEERVAEGWNWAKAPVMEAGTPAEIAWAAESNGRRAELVQRVVMGGAGAVQVCYVAHYLAETFRLLFFHAGCSLAPFCIAGLGVQSLQVQSVRALLGLLGVAFWPLAWAVGNVASHAMLEGALKVSAWTASSAMYPKVASGVERTLAMAAPYLSWWLLSVVVVMTLAVCAWMLGWLALGPWALHRVLSAGARGAGVL